MRKIPTVTEQELASVTIPNNGKRYAAITYSNIISEVKRQAAAHNIEIIDTVSELLKAVRLLPVNTF